MIRIPSINTSAAALCLVVLSSAGVQATGWPLFSRCKACPPYCSPTYGYYPTQWRSWPTTVILADDVEPEPAGPRVKPADAPKPPTSMPPANDARGVTPPRGTSFGVASRAPVH